LAESESVGFSQFRQRAVRVYVSEIPKSSMLFWDVEVVNEICFRELLALVSWKRFLLLFCTVVDDIVALPSSGNMETAGLLAS